MALGAHEVMEAALGCASRGQGAARRRRARVRNMLKTEALARHADAWAADGLAQCDAALLRARALAPAVTLLEVVLRPGPVAHKLCVGDTAAAAVDVAAAAASLSAAPPIRDWRAVIALELLALAS